MNTKKISLKNMFVLIISFFVLIYVIFSISTITQTIPVSSIQNIKVIPSGEIIGIKMYVDGVLVVGYSDVIGSDGVVYKPYESTNIKPGDRIIRINDNKITSSNDLINSIVEYNQDIEIEYIRDGEIFVEKIQPIFSKEDNKYHIGLWIKDGAVGLDTISFYNQEQNKFASLGHGILDPDTEQLLESINGEIVKAEIINIKKGKNSLPGEIKGVFNENISKGNILLNSDVGIYGNVKTTSFLNKYLDGILVANINEVQNGFAILLSSINGQLKEYNINIKKISKILNKDNKDITVKIEDEELLQLTGGIIQGMSGSPIIQNNKLVGVLTHVFVNDPTQGYAIFAETMANKMNNM